MCFSGYPTNSVHALKGIRPEPSQYCVVVGHELNVADVSSSKRLTTWCPERLGSTTQKSLSEIPSQQPLSATTSEVCLGVLESVVETWYD